MFKEDTRICGLPKCDQDAERMAQKRRAKCEESNEDDQDALDACLNEVNEWLENELRLCGLPECE